MRTGPAMTGPVRNVLRRSGRSAMVRRSGLLEQARLLVELLRARVERDARARGRGGCLDRLALGVPGVEELARVVVPERLGDLVDQRIGLLQPPEVLEDGSALEGSL